MKQLVLIRHAKSSWRDAGLADFERPLNDRGKRAVRVMAGRIASEGISCDALLSSPAARAAATAEALAESLGLPDKDIEHDKKLYTFDAGQLLSRIAELGSKADSLAVVGHNPAMTDLLNVLAAATIDNMPTCAVACLECDIKRWSQLGAGCARLTYYDYPKKDGR